MKRYLKLVGLLFALGVVTPLTWLERQLTGGSALRPLERILAGVAVVSSLWSGFLLTVYLPRFASVVADANLALPGVTKLLLDTPFFPVAATGVVLTTILAARLRVLSEKKRGVVLALCAFGGLATAQMIRFAVVLPFLGTGCPHG